VTAKQPATVNRTAAPNPIVIGKYYDHRVFDVMAESDANLHFGYWSGDDDPATFAQAMIEMTDQMIRRVDPAPGQRMLDVGCGNGAPALQLARARDGVEVVGVSVSERQVARGNEGARAAGVADRVRFEQVDAMHLPYPDASFDHAWALESMLHMPDKGQVLAEMARVVRPGGRIALADMTYTELPDAQRSSVPVSATTTYAALATLAEYEEHIRRAGLVTTDVTDVTKETARNHIEYVNWMNERRDQYVDIIGVEGFDLFVGNQAALGQMPELGYVLITAQRP
jgi:ubiquinone/menaquinone biosynthesis C-methylase UbiE